MEEGVAVVAEERQVESLLPFTLTGPPQETVPQSSRPTRETRSRRHTSPSTNDSAAAGGAWEGAGLLDSTRHSADSNPTEQELENNASDGVEDEDDAGKRRKTCINSTQSNGRLLDSNKDSLDGRQETTADSPRRQALRFEGDLYTPTWVRRDKAQKEGLCELCPPPGKWLLLKNSTFWYHKQFIHGISSVTGESFAPPSDIRIVWYLSPSTLPVPLSTATAGAKSPVDSYSPKTCQLCLIAEGHCAVCGDYIALQTSKKRSQILGMSLNDAQTILIGVNGQATLIPDLDGDTDCNDGTIRLLAHAKENGSILVPFPPDSAYSIQSHLGDVEQALKVRGQTMHWFRHAHKCHQPPLVEAKKKHGKKTARARSVSGPDLKAFPSTSSKSDSAVGKRRSSRRKTANKEHSTLSSVPVPVVSAPLDTVLETPIEENPPSAVREEGVSKMMDPPANSQMLPSHDVRRCLSEQNVAHESSTSIQHDTSKLDFTGLLNQGALPPPTNGGPSLLSVQLAPHYQADHVRRATIDVPVDYRFARHPYPPPSMGHSASYDPSVRPVPVSYMDQGSNFSYTHAVPEGLYSHVPYSNQYQGTDMPVLMTHSHTGSSASLSSGSSTATSSSGMNPRQRSQSAFDVPTSAFVSYSVPPVMLPPAFFMQRNDSKYGLQKPVRSMSMDMQPRPEPWMTQPSHSMGQFGGGLVGSSSIKCTGSTPPPLTLFSMYPPHPSSHERSHSMGLSTDMSNKLSLASGGNDQTLHGEWWQRDVSRGVVPGEYQPDGNHAS